MSRRQLLWEYSRFPPYDRVILVECGTAKTSHGEARDAFEGPLFEARREYAERLRAEKGVPWYILSALTGCIRPDQFILAGDERLSNLEGLRRTWWTLSVMMRVLEDLPIERRPTAELTLELHMSPEYAAPLQIPAEELGFKTERPTLGFGSLKTRLWYAKRTKEQA